MDCRSSKIKVNITTKVYTFSLVRRLDFTTFLSRKRTDWLKTDASKKDLQSEGTKQIYMNLIIMGNRDILHCFTEVHFIVFPHTRILRVYSNPALSKSVGIFSNSICSLCASVSRLSNSHISNIFIITMFVTVICGHRSFDVTTKDSDEGWHSKLIKVSVQSLSRVWLFATPWTAARQNFLKLKSIQSVMPSKLRCVYCFSPNIILFYTY